MRYKQKAESVCEEKRKSSSSYKGIAHVYRRKDINTDEIIPARYLINDKEEQLAPHAMEDIDQGFIKRVKDGDFIFAESNFGCGSSREHAVWALRGCGIKAVIADSFARIFYRNSINNGFPAIECKGIASKIDYGDEVIVDLAKGKIFNITKKEEHDFVAMPKFAIDIMDSGGLINYIKKNQGSK